MASVSAQWRGCGRIPAIWRKLSLEFHGVGFLRSESTRFNGNVMPFLEAPKWLLESIGQVMEMKIVHPDPTIDVSLMISCMKNLRSLDLSNFMIGDQNLPVYGAIQKHLPLLRKLVCNQDVTDDAICIISKLVNLKSLEISNGYKYTSVGVAHIVSELVPRLQSLSLCNGRDIPVETLKMIAMKVAQERQHSAPTLRRLNLSRTYFLDRHVLLQFAGNSICSTSLALDVRKCDQICRKDVRELSTVDHMIEVSSDAILEDYSYESIKEYISIISSA